MKTVFSIGIVDPYIVLIAHVKIGSCDAVFASTCYDKSGHFIPQRTGSEYSSTSNHG